MCLPVLARLHVPGRGRTGRKARRQAAPASTVSCAVALVTLLAGAFPGRAVHVVADAHYHGPALRDLPPGVTWTTRLPKNAVLYALAPPRVRKPGRPPRKGPRLGTWAEVAAAASWTPAAVRIYGRDTAEDLAEVTCLWYGCLDVRTVRVILARDAATTLALVTTDLAAPAAALVERYAARWSIEQAFADARNVLGAGEARTRVRRAVERTVPFALLVHTLVIIWYARHGHDPADIDRPARRRALVHHQDRARLRGHAHQAPPGHDLRPHFRRFPSSPRTRTNPSRPGSLARRRRITAKHQGENALEARVSWRSGRPGACGS